MTENKEIVEVENGEWTPTILQLRNLYHKYTKLKSDPLAEDTLELCVFAWAIKQLRKRPLIEAEIHRKYVGRAAVDILQKKFLTLKDGEFYEESEWEDVEIELVAE